MNDPAYKTLFSHREIIVDLLQNYLKVPWAGEVDFSTLEKVNASYSLSKQF